MSVGTKRIQLNKSLFAITAIMALYILFYLLKINGYMDISGKYGIERIVCEQIHDNELLLIDGEQKTVWGMTETHVPGECIEFKFKSARFFSKVDIDSPDGKKVPVKLSVSSDANEWRDIQATMKEDAERATYIFDRKEQGQYLRIAYMAEEEGHWPISEVVFHE